VRGDVDDGALVAVRGVGRLNDGDPVTISAGPDTEARR
jgi:hypothetical protein